MSKWTEGRMRYLLGFYGKPTPPLPLHWWGWSQHVRLCRVVSGWGLAWWQHLWPGWRVQQQVQLMSLWGLPLILLLNQIKSLSTAQNGSTVEMRHSLFFLCNSFVFTSFAFTSTRSCALVMFVAGVSFQRWEMSLVLAIVRRSWQRGRKVVEGSGGIMGQFISLPLVWLPAKVTRFNRVSQEWMLEFHIPPSPLFCSWPVQ